MLQQLRQFSDWFWNESFWLPRTATWKDITDNKHNIRTAQTHDLYIAIPLTVIIVLIRMIFERFVALPLLKHIGLKERNCYKAEPNIMLEKAYKELTGKLEEQKVKTLASKLGWTVKRVEQWFKYKRNISKQSRLSKAKESCWRCFFYTCACMWGFYFLRKEKYLYESWHLWAGYPHHDLSDGIYFYYVIELSFYISLLVSQFADVKRKDFWIQTIHHMVTISLLFFSFSINLFRVGSVILLIHDVSDVFLECGKVCKYLCVVVNIQKMCDVIFGVFAVVFFISRLVIYPWWIITSVFTEVPIIFKGIMPLYYWFVVLLLALQIMHIFWFYLIARMAYAFLVKGKVDNDARSETEESDSDDKNGVVQNGVANGKYKIQ